MKIFAVTNAYSPVPESFRSSRPGVCWYEIPDSAISRSGNPLFIPDPEQEYVAFPSAAWRIGKLGKSVAPRFAMRYIDAATIALAVVNLTLLRSLREAGLPWTAAVAFDRSCIIGNFSDIVAFKDCADFRITHAGEEYIYSLRDIFVNIEYSLAAISALNTIKTGDIILGALAPAMSLRVNAPLSVTAGDRHILDINVK